MAVPNLKRPSQISPPAAGMPRTLGGLSPQDIEMLQLIETDAAQRFASELAKSDFEEPFLKDRKASYYKYYEMDTPEDILPAVLTFSVASSTRLHKTRNFRVGSDVSYRTVLWVAIKRDSWPEIPPIDETNGPFVYRVINPLAPPVDADDGVFLYKITGKYVYVRDYPKAPQDDISVGEVPFLKQDNVIRTITVADQTAISGD